MWIFALAAWPVVRIFEGSPILPLSRSGFTHALNSRSEMRIVALKNLLPY
jgi:hypothetical protein